MKQWYFKLIYQHDILMSYLNACTEAKIPPYCIKIIPSRICGWEIYYYHDKEIIIEPITKSSS